MQFDIITLFPRLFDPFLNESIIGKALEKRAFDVRVIDIREFTHDPHRTADDRPFGGGPGMVLKPEPIVGAIEWAKESVPYDKSRVVLFTPAGRPLDQAKVVELAGLDHLVLVCGRYEGIDERVSNLMVDEEISVGDYVLAGGEIPAMLLVEAVARFLPGVVGKAESTEEETFSRGLLEYPQYTRPRVFRGLEVPDILLSGDHEAIRTWRLKASLKKTLLRRPGLIEHADLPAGSEKTLEEARRELVEEGADFKLDFPASKD